MSTVYTHGHHESALNSHRWRTVANSSAYVIPYLRPDMHVLDVGFGPGTISIDLAQNYVPNGKVVAVEYVDTTVMAATAEAIERGVKNIEFGVGDIHKLPFKDNTFDLVHAHQVLQHINDPVTALKEMLRVAKPGGYVAVRDADMGALNYYPQNADLDEWLRLYLDIARANGAEPRIGLQFKKVARLAGYPRENSTFTTSTWSFSTQERIDWWSGQWAERILKSNIAITAKEKKLATPGQLQRYSSAYKQWGQNEDAWFNLVHMELVHKK